ncbi:helix-turn-helix domain-containing protein [Winogradskyella sp.]|uniref:helix-turn-helix domain-containing protein n=1 Tax=Winogradskyella sp. TaxID=1883156 RepID=UPI003BAD1014
MNQYKYISKARIESRITQKELSEKTGISLRTIQRIENGEVAPRPYTIRTIEQTLGIKDYLEVEKTNPATHYSFLKWIFVSSLCLPLLYSIIALVYWKHLNVQQKNMANALRGIVYLNLITSCLAIPMLVVVTALILRSFDAPTVMRFLPLYIPIYWFYALINLWFTLHRLNHILQKESI